jgi:outer membrane protein insertion porin family
MNRIIIAFVFSLLYLSSTSLKSEIVKDLIIDGNNRISDETIRLYGGIKLQEDLSQKELNTILQNLYDTNFFEDVKLNIENNVLKINVKEFKVINQLVILGEKSIRYTREIKKLIKSKEKKSFIKTNLSEDINTIKQLYSSLGFNSAEVVTKTKNIDENNVDLIFEIEKGDVSKISSITFTGDKKIRDRRLRSIIASEEDRFYKIISRNTKFNKDLISLDIRLLTNYYKSLGYRDVQVLSNLASINDEGNINITYTINAGERYTINKLSTKVDSVLEEKPFLSLRKVYNKYIGTYYSPFKVKKILEEIDEIIEVNNIQFVNHNVQEEIIQNKINLLFNIFEGDKVLVERIDISGNNITNEDVIRGELLIDEGDPYTKLALEKSIAKIKARRIFKTVNYKVENGTSSDLRKIDIEVEERPTGEISAGAGIGTSGGTFALGIKENNWLGEGKRVGIDFEISSESILGVLSYEDPNYNFLGNSIYYALSSEENDKPTQGYENTIQRFTINTSFEQFKDINTTLGISTSYDDLQTDGSASENLKKQSGTFSEIAGSYAFSYDKRNRAFMPTSGSIISFGQDIPIYSDSAAIDTFFSSSTYRAINEDVVGAAKLYLSAINGLNDEDVRLSKRKSLSSKRLRGFEKGKVGPVDGLDHIGGNYASVLNFEGNLPNLLPEKSNTDISLFLDFGNVWGVDYDSSIDDSNKIRSTTGVAANWLSPLGPIVFTLSQNLSKANTDKTESFNFNLGTTF